MNKLRKAIVLDLDDTLLDFFSVMKKVCYEYCKFNLTELHCKNYSNLRHRYLDYNIIFNLILRSGHLSNIPLNKDTKENLWVIKQIYKKYKIIISTRRKFWEDKYSVNDIYKITYENMRSAGLVWHELRIVDNHANKLSGIDDSIIALIDDNPSSLFPNISRRCEILCIKKPWNDYLNHNRINKIDSINYLTKFL